MARPSNFEPDQVAEELLQTFWRRGYARTAIADLTAATKLLPGSLYGAFGNKEAMFRIAVARYQAYLRSAVRVPTRGVAGLLDLLDAVVRITVEDPERRGCLVINAIPEAASYSAETRQLLQDDLCGSQRIIRKRLLEAQRESGVRVDVDALAATLFSAIVGIRVLGRAGQTPAQLQAVADGAKLLVERYFARSRNP